MSNSYCRVKSLDSMLILGLKPNALCSTQISWVKILADGSTVSQMLMTSVTLDEEVNCKGLTPWVGCWDI